MEIKIQNVFSMFMFAILFILMNGCFLLTVNYALRNTYYHDVPYDLNPTTYLAFERELGTNEPFRLMDVITPHDDSTLTVIAKTSEESSIGLFDPTMKYYLAASSVVHPPRLRYFSLEDYQKERRVGIYLNTCSPFGFNPTAESEKNEKLESVINCLHLEALDNGSVTMVENLFTVDPSTITTLYVDSENLSELNQLKNNLLSSGFNQIETQHSSVIKSYIQSWNSGRHELFMATAGISAVGLYVFIVSVYFERWLKRIRIHQLVGGTLKEMLTSSIVQTMGMSLMVSALSYVFMMYLQLIRENYMTFLNFMEIQLWFLMGNIVLYTINYSVRFLTSKALVGRS